MLEEEKSSPASLDRKTSEIGLEPENGFLEENTEIRGIGFAKRVWNMTLDFEETHPWIFFGTITVIIFLLVVSFLAPLLDSSVNDSPTPASQPSSPELTVKVQPSVGKTAFQNTLLYTSKEGYLALIENSIANLDLDLRGSGFPESELLALKDAETALVYDIQENLRLSSNKQKTYSKYLNLITEIENEVRRNTEDLLSEKVLLETEIQETEAEFEDITSKLNQSLEHGSNEEIVFNVEPYTTKKEDLALLRNRLSMVVEILKVSSEPLSKLQARLAGLRANKEALIAGIEVVDIDNSGLELIRKGFVEDYS